MSSYRPQTALQCLLILQIQQLRKQQCVRWRLRPESKGLQVQVIRASTSREIDAAFAVFNSERPDGLFIAADPFFNSRRLQLSLLAMRHGVPTVYSGREYAEVGGLISYGKRYHRRLSSSRPLHRPYSQGCQAGTHADCAGEQIRADRKCSICPHHGPFCTTIFASRRRRAHRMNRRIFAKLAAAWAGVCTLLPAAGQSAKKPIVGLVLTNVPLNQMTGV